MTALTNSNGPDDRMHMAHTFRDQVNDPITGATVDYLDE